MASQVNVTSSYHSARMPRGNSSITREIVVGVPNAVNGVTGAYSIEKGQHHGIGTANDPPD